MIKYIIIFFIFSILGWIYEYISFNRIEYDKLSKKLFNVELPILPIYGVGGIILFFIYDKFHHYALLKKIIIAIILINVMECLLGQLSYKFYGYQTWKYSDDMKPSCHGYISLYSSLLWFISIYVLFMILDKLKK
ncbi:hypothetical protein Indivirus_7_18 [Indivirus ILV1]|uniref:Uncharacterized protein n=1 Tax=Indivirus ILV1 TaxID=1977633 RepID=A0A1V0SE72_9VIRU|nr:hypothetical protein Indivirus_7_18 [Indivirus ILV1]